MLKPNLAGYQKTKYLAIIFILFLGCLVACTDQGQVTLIPEVIGDTTNPTITSPPAMRTSTATLTVAPLPATETDTPIQVKETNTAFPPTITSTSIPVHTPTVTASPVPEGPFIEHTVANDLKTVSGVYPADIDGDGDLDLVAVGVYTNQISWWQNNSGEPITWSKQLIDDSLPGAVYVFVADMDGDFDNDLLTTTINTGEILLYRNLGNNPISWEKIIIEDGLPGVQGIVATDMDGDGDNDVLANVADADKVIWLRNASETGDGTSWIQLTIDKKFRNTQTIDAVDIDQDGDVDVIAGSGGDHEVALWINDGGNTIKWTKQIISNNFRWAHWVQAIDLDGDNRIDVVGAAFSDNEISWWRNEGGDPIVWKKQVIDDAFPGALTAHAVDLDGDGDVDMLGTANNVPELAWWRNDGGNPITWVKQMISSYYIGAWPVTSADIDGDGDMDVISGSASNLTWWENIINEE